MSEVVRFLTTSVILVCIQTVASPCEAVPGPDSVALLANAKEPGSLALMKAYARARHIPAGQQCTVDVAPYADLVVTDFGPKVRDPLIACLKASGALPRVEAIVLMRGMPRRLFVKGQPGNLRVSLAAALAVSRSVRTADDTSVVGLPAGVKLPAGNGFRATWTNPYKKGPFRPGFEATIGPFTHRMWLVTALDGYSFADARKLIDSALAADPFDLKAQWLLMKGADKARGALDSQFPAVKAKLEQLIPSPVVIEKYNANLKGRHLGAFVVGTAKIGDTIEGNTFAPGALVDNLTSFGARPENFTAPEDGGKQVQVSIARWVRKGVGGVHGTVSEPLNNCFASRHFLADYAAGATLAESYWRNLPYVYWMNLILGDPMVAPFSKKPEISVFSDDGSKVEQDIEGVQGAAISLRAFADGKGDAIGSLRVFVGGEMVVDVAKAATTIEASFEVEAGAGRAAPHDPHVLVIAQFAKGNQGGGVWRSKGWRAWRIIRTAAREADTSGPDTDAADSGGGATAANSGTNPADSGCSARPRGPSGDPLTLLLLAVGALLVGVRTYFGFVSRTGTGSG